MSRRLPPLNALRAFEAAARHLSFTKAAEELNVTPAAISHQVKSLEEMSSGPLFRRLTRALRLTDQGQAALPLLSDGLDMLAEGAAVLSGGWDENLFTVTTPPSFAGRWLVPRLDEFQEQNPDIKVRLDASMALVDLRRDGIDVAIRYGSGKYPGHQIDRLFQEEMFPVCSPKLMQGAHPLTEPKDLVHHILLHAGYAMDNPSYPDWRMWLKSAGVKGIDWRKGPEFSQENMAVQAALQGHGVALANFALAGDDIASGTLVRPFEHSVVTDFAYFLVIPEEYASRPAVAAFREWILKRACS